MMSGLKTGDGAEQTDDHADRDQGQAEGGSGSPEQPADEAFGFHGTSGFASMTPGSKRLEPERFMRGPLVSNGIRLTQSRATGLMNAPGWPARIR